MQVEMGWDSNILFSDSSSLWSTLHSDGLWSIGGMVYQTIFLSSSGSSVFERNCHQGFIMFPQLGSNRDIEPVFALSSIRGKWTSRPSWDDHWTILWYELDSPWFPQWLALVCPQSSLSGSLPTVDEVQLKNWNCPWGRVLNAFLNKVKEPRKGFCEGGVELNELREGFGLSPTAQDLDIRLALASEVSSLPLIWGFELTDLDTWLPMLVLVGPFLGPSFLLPETLGFPNDPDQSLPNLFSNWGPKSSWKGLVHPQNYVV